MLVKALKSFISAIILSIVCCTPVLAAEAMPFKAEFDVDMVERSCYAGHGGSAIRYKDGYAVTPDTCFTIVEDKIKGQFCDVSQLSAEVALIYENEDNSGSYKEVLRSYDPGSLNTEDSFPLLSENTIANLSDRDRLYSSTLNGFVLTLKYKGRQTAKETIYLYVCDDDAYYEYYDRQFSGD